MVQRTFHHGLRVSGRRISRGMCFSTEPEFTPMRIGRWRAFCRLHDRLYTVRAADVARIQANLVHAGPDRRQRETVVKVDVRHHRQRRARCRFRSASAACISGTALANNVAARVRQCANLRQSSLRVARVRVIMDCTAMARRRQPIRHESLSVWSFFIPLPLSLN